MKNKGWIIFGVFVISAIIAFAIYRATLVKDTIVETGGGSQTKANNGLLELLNPLKSFFGFGA